MADKIPDEVASLLIPMVGRPMLLPNVAVAEIVPWVEPEKQDNAPEWFLGECLMARSRYSVGIIRVNE